MKSGYVSEVVVPRSQKLLRDSFGRRMVGFACSRAWVSIVFLTPALMASSDSQTTLDFLNNASRMVLILTLAAGAFLLERVYSRATRKALCWTAAAFAVVGTIMVPFGGLSGGLQTTVLAIAAALTGIGSGMMLLLWGHVYGSMSGPSVAAEASIAQALQILVFPACIVFPREANAVVASLVLLGSAIALVGEYADSSSPENAETNDAITEIDHASARRLLTKIVISTIAIGFVLNALRYIYERQVIWTPDSDVALVLSTSALLGSAIVLAVLIFSRRLDLAFSYRPVLLLLALGCFLLPLLSHASSLPYFFARAGYMAFTILAWVLMADLSYRSSLPAFRVFGIGQTAVYAGLFLGTMTGNALVSMESAVPNLPIAASGLLSFGLIAVYTFVLTERDVSHIIKPPSKAASASASEETAGEKPATAEDQETARALDQNARCEHLAARFGLGERATEVMVLYSKGRSRTRIEQELFISKGTVNFHLRNIYQTLGIHSKQELLDLIDAETVDED